MNRVELWPLLSCEGIVLAIFAFIPIIRGEHAFFGVPVAREFYSGEGQRILRRYRLALLAIFGLFALAGASLLHTATVLPVAAIGPIIAALLVYAKAFSRVRTFRAATSQTRFSSSLRPRSLTKYTRPIVELAIIILTVVPALTMFAVEPALPSIIPMHWNAAGQPDSWMRKGLFAVWFMPLLTVYMQAWLLLLKHDAAGLRITLPANGTEEYLQGKERVLQLAMRLMDWVRIGLATTFAIMALLPVSSIEPFRDVAPKLFLLLWCATGILVIAIGVLTAQWIRTNNALNRRFGFANVERRDDIEHWLGGMIYFNRDDPAFMVEMLGGVGYTINCGHRRALLHLALLAGVLLLVILMLHAR